MGVVMLTSSIHIHQFPNARAMPAFLAAAGTTQAGLTYLPCG